MNAETSRRNRRGHSVMIIAVALCPVLGCAAVAPSVRQTAGGNANTDARTASPDLLADKSTHQTDLDPKQTLAQGSGSAAEMTTEVEVTEADQKGMFNTSLAIVGGSSAAGLSGLVGIALWLRWARQTSKARTDAQTLRIKMLVDLVKDAMRSRSGSLPTLVASKTETRP